MILIDKKEFLGLNWGQRAEYLNKRIAELGTYEKACKELGISISQTGTLKKHGWILSGGTFIYDENLDKEINNSTAKVKNIDNNIPGQKTLFDKTDTLQNDQDNKKIKEHTNSINQSKHNNNDSTSVSNTGYLNNYLNYKTATSLENGLDSVEHINMERECSKNSEEIKKCIDVPLNNKNDDLTYIESNSKQVMEEISRILTSNNTDSQNEHKKAGRPSKPGRKKYSLNLDEINFKKLQIHCILNDENSSDIINKLLDSYLKKLYENKQPKNEFNIKE